MKGPWLPSCCTSLFRPIQASSISSHISGVNEVFANVNIIPSQSHNFLDMENVH
jgi:hypothetical protein